jgi:hypothetical protein
MSREVLTISDSMPSHGSVQVDHLDALWGSRGLKKGTSEDGQALVEAYQRLCLRNCREDGIEVDVT